ncbi:beta-lactamase family protein [Paenibacillus rhizovicinus]|uniref:Beta-lactamase family protein n=1 Tax=Paenibacillus rhizovicinus TaxID=2704463 RepID=A0A6C0NY45_9BACL|nr:serine hydrolase domain-containing protein [Paenibacillus rhizovicinus]QHW31137.1 beta-lactamase family protein [Paenibacillus rhizovicinus]
MKEIQQHMQAFLERMVGEGRERGVQLAAYYEGELVVDAWAGIADNRSGRAVDASTLFPVFSTTKGIASTVLHLAVERLGIDYDMRISELWPEFGANGKADATIRHALSHTTGIPHMPEAAGPAEVLDWSRMRDEVAKLVPQWTPGTRMEYHAITFGWIIGEIARRLDGRSFARMLKEDICDPLGIGGELYVGIPEEADARVAFLEEPEFDPAMFPATGLQPIPAWICPLSDWMNRPEARRACVPASNGIMTAKGIAKHYASLLPDGADGIRLLPQSRVRLATELQDLLHQEPQFRALGYQLGSPGSIMGGRATVFGHGGYGGSVGFADPDQRLAVGFVNNLYSGASAGFDSIRELKKELGLRMN